MTRAKNWVRGLALLSIGYLCGGLSPALAQGRQVQKELQGPFAAAAAAMKSQDWAGCLARVKEAESLGIADQLGEEVIARITLKCAMPAYDFESAVKAMERLLASGRLDPKEASTFLQSLAKIEYQRKNYRSAAEYGRRYLSSATADDESIQSIVGQSYYLAGDYKAARDFLLSYRATLQQKGASLSDPENTVLRSACLKLGDAVCESQTRIAATGDKSRSANSTGQSGRNDARANPAIASDSVSEKERAFCESNARSSACVAQSPQCKEEYYNKWAQFGWACPASGLPYGNPQAMLRREWATAAAGSSRERSQAQTLREESETSQRSADARTSKADPAGLTGPGWNATACMKPEVTVNGVYLENTCDRPLAVLLVFCDYLDQGCNSGSLMESKGWIYREGDVVSFYSPAGVLGATQHLRSPQYMPSDYAVFFPKGRGQNSLHMVPDRRSRYRFGACFLTSKEVLRFLTEERTFTHDEMNETLHSLNALDPCLAKIRRFEVKGRETTLSPDRLSADGLR